MLWKCHKLTAWQDGQVHSPVWDSVSHAQIPPPAQRSPVVVNGIALLKQNLECSTSPFGTRYGPARPPTPEAHPRLSLCIAAARGEYPPPPTHGGTAVSHLGADSDPFLHRSRLSALNEARGANRAPPVTTGRRCAEKHVRGVGVGTVLCQRARGCGGRALVL